MFHSSIGDIARRMFLALVLTIGIGFVAAPVADAATPSAASMALAAYNRLNLERRVNGLPTLPRAPQLTWAAYLHALWMARTNTMSHQLPGEAPLGARLTAAGYRWWAGAENVGWSSAANPTEAVRLEKLMYYERAPYDGHRINILNPAYVHVGVAVVIDRVHHKMWLVMDFGRPA